MARDLLIDPGTAATLLGYGEIKIEIANFYTILNRTSIVGAEGKK